MNTQHLKYAIEVERTGSITQAADNLYIGQPSLSKAIRELEESLGIVIFKRTSKGAVPTEKGLEFLKYARAVMVQIEKMEMLYRPNHPDSQEFFVSIPRSCYIAMAAGEFVRSLDVVKELEAEIREGDAAQVLEDVIRGEAGLGVVRFRVEDETYFTDYFNTHELRQETVWEFERLVTLSKKHPLAERLQLRSEELFRFVEVVMRQDALPYPTARVEERRDDERPEKQIRVQDRLNQMELCASVSGAYMWSEPLPAEILEKYALTQHVCPVKRGRYRDVLVYRWEHEFTPIEKRFINKLYECRNRVAFRQ